MREFLAEGDVRVLLLPAFLLLVPVPAQSEPSRCADVSQLLVAEVQAFFQDGAMSLHTRSLKYGKVRHFLSLFFFFFLFLFLFKLPQPRVRGSGLTLQLRNGLLLSLPPRLIRRLKSHFHHIPPPCGPTGVDLILGLNGYVWVSMGTAVEQREGGDGFDAEGVYSDKNDVR
jgi:exosome complex component RRP4